MTSDRGYSREAAGAHPQKWCARDILHNTAHEDGHLAIFSRFPYRDFVTRPGDALTVVCRIDVEEASPAEHTATYRSRQVRSLPAEDIERITTTDNTVHALVRRAATGWDVIDPGEYTVVVK